MSESKVVEGIVKSITNGKDGYAAEIDVQGACFPLSNTCTAIVSIPNIGDVQKYKKIEVGEFVILTGNVNADVSHMIVLDIIKNVKLKLAAVCIIEVGSAILLLQRRHPLATFCLPGGKVDATDKSIKDAIIREVEEETGIKIDKPIKIGEVLSALDDYIVHVHYVKLDKMPMVVLSSEHVGFLWTMTANMDEPGFEFAGNTSMMIKKMNNG